jgi:hypothetical protein
VVLAVVAVAVDKVLDMNIYIQVIFGEIWINGDILFTVMAELGLVEMELEIMDPLVEYHGLIIQHLIHVLEAVALEVVAVHQQVMVVELVHIMLEQLVVELLVVMEQRVLMALVLMVDLMVLMAIMVVMQLIGQQVAVVQEEAVMVVLDLFKL